MILERDLPSRCFHCAFLPKTLAASSAGGPVNCSMVNIRTCRHEICAKIKIITNITHPLNLFDLVTSPDCHDRVLEMLDLRYILGGATSKREASISETEKLQLEQLLDLQHWPQKALCSCPPDCGSHTISVYLTCKSLRIRQNRTISYPGFGAAVLHIFHHFFSFVLKVFSD